MIPSLARLRPGAVIRRFQEQQAQATRTGAWDNRKIMACAHSSAAGTQLTLEENSELEINPATTTRLTSAPRKRGLRTKKIPMHRHRDWVKRIKPTASKSYCWCLKGEPIGGELSKDSSHFRIKVRCEVDRLAGSVGAVKSSKHTVTVIISERLN